MTTTVKTNDQGYRDDYAVQQKKLKQFLEADPNASFKKVWDRYLVHMLDAMRGDLAETRGEVDAIVDSLEPPATQLLDDMEELLKSFGVFVDKLMRAGGFVDENTKDLPDDFPLREEFHAIAAQMSEMNESIRQAREDILDYEDDEDDEDEDEDEDEEDEDEDGDDQAA